LWWIKWHWRRFSLSTLISTANIQTIAPQSISSVIWDWCNSPVVAAVPSGLSLVPLLLQVPHTSCIEKKDFWIICVYHCVRQCFSNFVTSQPPKIIYRFMQHSSLLFSEKYSFAHCCRSLVRLYGDSRNLTSFTLYLHLQ
jgi:hypothetical protein